MSSSSSSSSRSDTTDADHRGAVAGVGAAAAAARVATRSDRLTAVGRRCEHCRRDLPREAFSGSQLRRHSAPCCIECTQRPGHEQQRVLQQRASAARNTFTAADARGGAAATAATSSPAPSQLPPGIRHCALCQRNLPRSAFSCNQFSRKRDAPHCLECTQRPGHEHHRVMGRRPVPHVGPPRARMFRCELCRFLLDEGKFAPSEIAEHAQAPRCATCAPSRRDDSASAGGGAAAAAAMHPCLGQNATGRCAYPSPCCYALVRADRCLQWLLGACGHSDDHDGLSHDLTETEHQLITAVQQVQQKQQQQQEPALQLQQPLQQPQHQQERVGQRREREDYGDDGFATRRDARF